LQGGSILAKQSEVGDILARQLMILLQKSLARLVHGLLSFFLSQLPLSPEREVFGISTFECARNLGLGEAMKPPIVLVDSISKRTRWTLPLHEQGRAGWKVVGHDAARHLAE
jgi:hypothetical protein